MATPVYLSVAWTLMISYQLFTQTAVTTVVESLNLVSPALFTWLTTRIDMIVFVYAFTWVFVLSSVIPSKILGGERSVIVQFLVCLALTLSAFIILNFLRESYGAVVDQIFSLSSLLNNPVLATLYLATPYILMISLDIKAKNRRKQEKQRLVHLAEKSLESKEKSNQNYKEAE